MVLRCLTLAIVGASALHAQTPTAQPADSPARRTAAIQDAMAVLSDRFEDLKAATKAARPVKAELKAACSEIERTAAALAKSVTHPSKAWARGLSRVVDHASRMRANLSAERWPALDENLAALRKSCVTCHSRFQEPDKQHSRTPALRNTIHGRVVVKDKQGRTRSNRADLVVFLDSVPGDWKPLRERQLLTQRSRSFHPAVLPIVVGGEVEFPNDDLILHNVFSLSKTRVFDLGMYGAGKSKTVRFDKKGLVRVYCNIHPDMSAHVLVLANPYFTKTGPDGEWALTDVPDGKYDLRVWSAFGGRAVQRIELKGNAYTEVQFTVEDTATRVPHKNKFGRSYRGQYGRD